MRNKEVKLTPAEKQLEDAKDSVKYYEESVELGREALERQKQLYYEANDKVTYWTRIVELEKSN